MFFKIILTVVLEKNISDFGIIPSEKKCSFNGFWYLSKKQNKIKNRDILQSNNQNTKLFFNYKGKISKYFVWIKLFFF